jgi:cellulose synthase/poly-beta-1,6-N-acetylglucosamine synthase-like glycosyltransferase
MTSISTYTPSSQQKKPKKAGKNRGWISLYVAMILLWMIVLTATVRSWLFGTEAVVDSLDITYFTLPALVFNLVFVTTTFVIYLVYFGSYRRAVKHQRQIISIIAGKDREEDLHDDHQISALGSTDSMIATIRKKTALVTIIIPARNEQGVIAETVSSCLRQTYPNIEVVVICHNCNDGTFVQASSVPDHRVRAYELNTNEAGKGIALNYGVQMAKGDYLLVLDGDGRLNDTFVDDALPMFASDHSIAAVQGRYIPSNRSYNFITRMLALEGDLWSTPFMTFRNVKTRRTPLGGTGYIVRKDILIKVGGFANHLVDDYELTFRLLRENHRIAFAPLCVNYDEKPPTLDIMLKQRARWLRGFFNLLRTRVAEPSDLVGHLYWVNPVTSFTGLAMLLLAAFSTIHYVLFLYYPFHYSYIPLLAWFGLTTTTFVMYTAALVMQYGRSGFKHAAWLPVYLLFSNYYMIVALKALFVKSWADTKTVHGFTTKENIQGQQSTILQDKGDQNEQS